MVVYAVVCHCLLLVVDMESGPELWGREMQSRDTLFYLDDGIIGSTQMEWIQGLFDSLAGIFDQVVLSTNVGYTFFVVCKLC